MYAAIVLIVLVSSSVGDDQTVLGKLKSGLQMVGKLLGTDKANGVAQLVAETFGKSHAKGDGSELPGNIFSGFLRLFGFDSKKIGAIAINAIIFVAQLVSATLSQPKIAEVAKGRMMRNGSPFDWMMENPKVVQMLSYIKDKNLADHVIMHIRERALDEDTDCVQLLVCKSAPFIWGMQEVLEGTSNGTVKGLKSLFAYLPSLDDVIDHSDVCDKEHPYCFVHM